MFFLHILILYHLLEEVIFTLYYLYTTTSTIEAVYPWRDSACIVCNDNGIAENLPLNRILGNYDIIHGTFFVCGLTRDDFTDLTPQQMKHYEEMYHDPQLFFLLGKTLCVEHTTPEEYTRVMAPPPKTKESPER